MFGFRFGFLLRLLLDLLLGLGLGPGCWVRGGPDRRLSLLTFRRRFEFLCVTISTMIECSGTVASNLGLASRDHPAERPRAITEAATPLPMSSPLDRAMPAGASSGLMALTSISVIGP